MNLEKRKKILVAPLNSGLGHATRCIPIIEALDNHGFEPVIASDGAALLLLKKEFPQHSAVELPSYQIEYAKAGSLLNPGHLMRLGRMFAKITHEHKMVRACVHEMGISGIISDSRPGAYYNGVPSVIITHQLNIISGDLPGLSTHIQQSFIKKYRECWIPDVQASINLSGKMGHSDDTLDGIRYMGTLSRLHKTGIGKKYDLAVLLTIDGEHCLKLEMKLKEQLQLFNGSVIFIRGVIEPEQLMTQQGNVTYYNFMKSDELEEVLNNSTLVLARPSYSNIMDLSKLCKKVLFIPIPGNDEQLYLAKKLKKAGLTPYSHQKNFKLADIEKAGIYKGLRDINGLAKWKDLFSLFEGK